MGRFNLIIAIVAMFVFNTIASAASNKANITGKSSSSIVTASTGTATNMVAADPATIISDIEAKSSSATCFEAFTADDALALVEGLQGINTSNAILSGSIDMLMAESTSMPSIEMISDEILVASK